jgi:hypothetical protein
MVVPVAQAVSERRELRVIIAMEDGLVIITVIDIKDRGKHED